MEGRQQQAGEGMQDQQCLQSARYPKPHPALDGLEGSPGSVFRTLFHRAAAWPGFVPGRAQAVPPALQPELVSAALPGDAPHSSQGREPEKAFAFHPDFPG